MGADFLLSCLEIPSTAGDLYRKQVRAAGKRLRAFVRSSDFDVAEVLRNHQGAEMYDGGSPSATKKNIAAVISRVEKALLLEQSRQIATFWLNGRQYAFVGGMSWGDPASDYSDDFDLLIDLKLSFFDPDLRCTPTKACPSRFFAIQAKNDVKDAAFAAGLTSNWRFCPWCGEQEG